MRSPAASAVGCGRQRSGIKRRRIVQCRAETAMTSIDRSTPRRADTCATLAHLFGLALAFGAIGTPAHRAVAADNSREIFEILDENGDGVVPRAEFLRTKIEVFYRALRNVDQDQRLGPAEINVTPEAFADADRNGDGKISGAEFVQARFTQFEAIDTSGDQEITFEEFREFMQQYQLQP
jgi:Ca2+-binding EF-hand superfamily protein